MAKNEAILLAAKKAKIYTIPIAGGNVCAPCQPLWQTRKPNRSRATATILV